MSKRIFMTMAVAGGIGFAAGYAVMHHSLTTQRAAWQTEQTRRENELADSPSRQPVVKTITSQGQVVHVTDRVAPEVIVGQLVAMKAASSDPQSVRRLIHEFESLIEAGPAALPAIRSFLARNQDVEYDVGFARGGRDGNVPLEFTVPPSLRLGLLEAAKRIGGSEAETLLADTLKTTGRGIEVAYLARALQQMAPGKYRDTALASAHELLASPLTDPSDPLGRYDRNYLFGVLLLFNDNSAAALAQSQVILTNGRLDQVALRYLQQTMSTQSVAMAAQLYQDPRVAADQKEPLARIALTYAGTDDRANQMLQSAINDPNMSADAR
ncbi:MAG TPA: hypothetical protein VN625_07505, partial [Desulfuromonadaceae bacterium]|nr:hypothetical protein [Desulfuromonadaceae bacterium]